MGLAWGVGATRLQLSSSRSDSSPSLNLNCSGARGPWAAQDCCASDQPRASAIHRQRLGKAT